ncbi:hypothetical protein POTOM_019872 [Populus tomentosa]|uniref:Bax inhibitor-1 family protein n=1 Tax=Populus tomentosa TaxID=118781 RepID=A0A8X7ZWC6_POPTO|nr:hypothetical protein POTOM_019872 [Populus tomentosa]
MFRLNLSQKNHCSLVSIILLLPATPTELSSPWSFYHCSRISGWTYMCVYQCCLIIGPLPNTSTCFKLLLPREMEMVGQVWLEFNNCITDNVINDVITGKVILQSAIITFTAMVVLTLYTFWAARRGHDFSFLGPFLSASLIALLLFALIQIFFPLGRISVMIFGGLASILFCGFIIYDTDSLIKRYAYDEYIWAAVSLYLDIINLFLSILTVCSAQDS